MGSTCVARRAGMKQASTPTPTSNPQTAAKVHGSVARTPKSRLSRKRVAASEAIIPAADPITTSTRPCFTTMPSTSRRCAPSAARIPISRVRRATSYDSKPYNPMHANSIPSNPKREDSRASNRSPNSNRSIVCDCVRTPNTGKFSSTWFTMCLTSGIKAVGAMAERKAKVTSPFLRGT